MMLMDGITPMPLDVITSKPSDPFMSHLANQLDQQYSAGEFQALQLIVLAAFGVAD